jgi:hypothetical protein
MLHWSVRKPLAELNVNTDRNVTYGRPMTKINLYETSASDFFIFIFGRFCMVWARG